ncbi:unnamed protein product [Closterium sp. Yama58-4]|nr:unnamed protein product [Closterium sp. Yama58-4]
MESSGGTDGERQSRFSTRPPNPLPLLSRRGLRGSAIPEALRKPNPLSLLSRRVLMASASLLHSPPSPSNPPVSPFLLPPSQLLLLPSSSPASPASPAPLASAKSPSSLLASQPSPKTRWRGNPVPTEGPDNSALPWPVSQEAAASKAAMDGRADSCKVETCNLETPGLKPVEWIPESPRTWLETWADPIASSWKEERSGREQGMEVGWKKEADKVKSAVQERSEALKRGFALLQRGVETQGESLKRGAVALQRDVEAQSEAVKQGVVTLLWDVESQSDALKRGLVSLQQDVEARNEALKRGVVSLQRDVEARNEAVKRGVVALQRDVEANVLSFQRGAEFWRRVVHLYGSYKVRFIVQGSSLVSLMYSSILYFPFPPPPISPVPSPPLLPCPFHSPLVFLFPLPLSSPTLSPYPHLPSPLVLTIPLPLCQLQVAVSGQSEEEKTATWQRQHERGAEMLYALCTDMKGFFLKAGQFLAKPDLSPPAWVRRLSALHDDAPADPLPLVLRTIQEELGGVAWREVWEWVEEKPLGSASIAQVHRGRLRGGKEVAIKVQHAGAEPLMLTDLANLKTFAAFLQSTELNLDIMGALNELERQIRQSGECNAGGSAGSSPVVVVPASVPGLATKRLLVMDLIKGSQLASMEEQMRAKGVNPNGFLSMKAKRSIFRSLGTAYGLMILRDGHFQADPHPGNLLICPDRKVALLDYGQTKRLPDSLRLNLARLMLAVADKDLPRVGSLFQALGIRTTRTVIEDPRSFHRMSSLMFDTGVSEGVTTSNPFASESTLKRNGIEKFPEDLFFVVRTMQLLRGLAMGMGLNESLAEQWRPIAQAALKEAGGM